MLKIVVIYIYIPVLHCLSLHLATNPHPPFFESLWCFTISSVFLFAVSCGPLGGFQGWPSGDLIRCPVLHFFEPFLFLSEEHLPLIVGQLQLLGPFPNKVQAVSGSFLMEGSSLLNDRNG